MNTAGSIVKNTPVEFYFLLLALAVVYLAAKGKFSSLAKVLSRPISTGVPGRDVTSPSYYFGQRTGNERTLSGNNLPIG